MGVPDNDCEEERVGAVVSGDGDFRHGGDVVKDSLDVVPVLVDGVLDGVPYGVCAGHVKFPVLAYGLELGEIDEDAIVDGLSTGI